MQIDGQGQRHSYYGTWNVKDKKPKEGVHFLMFERHVNKTMEKEKEQLHKELSNVISNFNKSLQHTMDRYEKEIKTLRFLLSDLTQFMYKMVDLNELKTPEIEKIVKKKKFTGKVKIPTRNKEEDEDFDDGYL